MKAVYITLCVLLYSCTPLPDQETDNIVQHSEPVKYFSLDKHQIGLWVNEKYLSSLQNSKSTKKSQEGKFDDFYRLSDGNSVMRMNCHEGGTSSIILMTSPSSGVIVSLDSSESYFEVDFIDDLMIVGNDRYFGCGDKKEGLLTRVNNAFFSGQYLLDGKNIEFKSNGIVYGLDSIQSFKLNLDYIDAGMQYDKIYFQFNNEPEPRTYLYGFSSDTLRFFEIDCLTEAEDYDYCLEVQKGPVSHVLIRT
ncbi:MAG: hypothetical protein JKY52_10140 [Flavobacteriales bacterium]|nr:hypothetical protein [Flavobacteriales bacterium]